MPSASSSTPDLEAADAPRAAQARPAECPSAAILQQLLIGGLEAPQSDEVRHHLSGCLQCQSLLNELSDHATLRDWKSDSAVLTSAAAEPADLRRLLDRLRQTPPPGAAATSDSDATSGATNFGLGPPEQEGDLGTLGSFRVLAELGRGGMGIVYRAYDTALARTVALKVLRWERVDDQARSRFVREAQAAARLEHENVVAVYAVVNPPDGPPYLVMRYVAGQTLRERIDAHGPLEAREAARLVAQVADGLAAAHRAGLVHRDVKPANIMLDSDLRRARIMDFGLVRILEQAGGATLEGTIPGTPEYMSPEQIRDPAVVDERSDVYGLGVSLYEGLTGAVPFRGTTTMVLQQVVSDEPISPRRLSDRVPRDLETVCLKAMAKEPGRRYQSAALLRDDLNRWLGGEPIRARPAGRLEKAWRWCRRRPREATLLAAVAILVVAIIGVTSLSAWRQSALRNVAVENLRDSYLSQAQALRWSGQAGRRFKSLDALAKAAKIRPGLDLRNEAIACMPLVDLRVVRQWNGNQPHAFDRNLARYARTDATRDLVSVRRVSDDAEQFVVPGFGSGANGPAFSPDGKWLFVGHDAHGVQVWDVEAGKTVLALAPAGSEKGLHVHAISPDSRRFAVHLGDKILRICDLPSGREIQRVDVGARPAYAIFHPTEEQLGFHGWWGTAVRILNIRSGQVETSLPHPTTINSYAWRPDGRYLAVSCADGAVRVWDVTSEKLHHVMEGHKSWATGCVFNHTGDLLATNGWDVTTRLWDVVTGQQLVSIPGYGMHFSPDDRRLSYSFTDMRHEAGIWEVATGQECRTFHAIDEQGDGPRHVDIHPRARVMATASSDGVRLWDMAAGKEVAHLATKYGCVPLFHPSGDSLITSGVGGVWRWPLNIDSQSGLWRFGPPDRLAGTSTDNFPAISRDGRWLAIVKTPSQAEIIDLHHPQETVQLGNHPGITTVAISPDGRLAVTGTQHGAGVKVWDAKSGRLEKEFAVENYGWGQFHPDGRTLLVGGARNTTQAWEVGSWREIIHETWNGDGGFSADGRFFAMRTKVDREIRLLDATTYRELATLTAPNQLPISGLCFSPDGSLLAGACNNSHCVQLWDLRLIRTQLAAMNLDWKLPPYPTTVQRKPSTPLRIELVSDVAESAR